MNTASCHAPLRLLIVEDNHDLRAAMQEALARYGYCVQGVDCAEVVPELGTDANADVCIVDLQLPGEDGLSLARRLRQVQPQVGIIMLTARQGSAERAAGYDSGADIYITKPASPAELHAAIQALARRIQAAPAAANSALVLDLRHMHVQSPSGSTRLTAAESQVLAALARAPGQRLERWQLLVTLNGQSTAHSAAALEMVIARLRKKLQPLCPQAQNPVRPIRGVGYQLCVRVTLG